MDTHRLLTFRELGSRKSILLIICSTALLSLFSGAILGSGVFSSKPVEASSSRVFELMIYHTLPGKASDLESVFRNSYKLQAKYGLDVIGYWVPNDDPAWNDTFIYLIAHPSRAEADAHWKAFHADPAFPPLRAAAAKLIQQVNRDYRVDEIFMRPSDFSKMK
jgi:NIPSNAP protein